MKKNIYLISTFLLCCIICTSCTSGNIGSGSGEIIDAKSSIDVRSIHQISKGSLSLSSVIWLPDPSISDEKRQQLLRDCQNSAEFYEALQFAKNATKMDSWQQVHAAAQECINKTSRGYYSFYAHQLIATTMLNTYFLLQKPTPDVQKAAGYYMDILAGYQNYYDLNLKAAILPLLIGYWSTEKIQEVAQKNYHNSGFKLTTEEFLRDFYPNELSKQAPEHYSQMSIVQISSKIQQELEAKISAFPKRTSPFPNALTNNEEYKKCTNDSRESIAILALLAQGTFAGNTKK